MEGAHIKGEDFQIVCVLSPKGHKKLRKLYITMLRKKKKHILTKMSTKFNLHYIKA